LEAGTYLISFNLFTIYITIYSNVLILLQKVPLHLSYRIFETSSKRLTLMDASIDSVELKDEKALKREWKEVQLKISETGVMSVTDISNIVHKRETEIENLQDEKTSEEIASVAEIKKADSLIENCGISKSSVEIMPSTLITDTQMTKNPIFSDPSNTFLVPSDVKHTSENSLTKNCTSLPNQHNETTTKQVNETRNSITSAKLQQDVQEVKVHNQTANVEDKSETVLQEQKATDHSVTQFTEENVVVIEDKEKMDVHAKKMSINNNNNSTDFQAETQKECIKNSSEAKMGNAGSKKNWSS